MAGLPRQGYDDFRRRLRILRLLGVRFRLRRALFEAEVELGWLGWEQVDFYEDDTAAAVQIVKEFENTQASLQNTAAELAARKALLDKELAREQAVHDETRATLDAGRAPIAARFQEIETSRRLKVAAAARFDTALEEIAGLEKRLQARSHAFMNVVNPTAEIRADARNVSDQLGRVSGERTLVLADRARAANEAAALEATLDELRGELTHIDTAAAAARETLAAAARRLAGEARALEEEKKKSTLHMAHLDRKKKAPYRLLGASLADSLIAPLNQPGLLDKVLTLREQDRDIADLLATLHAQCAAMHPGILISFYLLVAAVLFAIAALASRFF